MLVPAFGSLFIGTAFSSEESPVVKNPGLSPKTSGSSEGQSPGKYIDQGVLSFDRGAFDDAIVNFEAAIRLCEQDTNKVKQCEALIRLSQASHFTGQYKKALQSLEKAMTIARELNDGHQIAAIFGSMGNVYIGMGNGNLALENLNQGLLIAKESGYVRCDSCHSEQFWEPVRFAEQI